MDKTGRRAVSRHRHAAPRHVASRRTDAQFGRLYKSNQIESNQFFNYVYISKCIFYGKTVF
jgi:hypothetical protein